MANKSKSVQMSSASPSPLSRRTFLGRMGVSTAAAATAVGMPSLLGNKVLASQEVESPDVAGIIPEAGSYLPNRFQVPATSRMVVTSQPMPMWTLWLRLT
jgi:hypothetical protein